MTIFDGLADAFVGALGEEVTVAPLSGSPRAIRAMVVARVKESVGVVTPMPAIHARSADVADLSDGDEITARGVDYVAREFRPDGRGMTTIIMEVA